METMAHASEEMAEAIRDRLVTQLIAVNQQLEQFAYVASHDLREPLRIIVCFSDLLEKEYGDKLDETARKYIDINRGAARRMEALVTDLLEYSKTSNQSQKLEATDANQALRDAKHALMASIDESDAAITCPDLPAVKSTPMMMTSLFQNLIGNAIKYKNEGSQPQIDISYKLKDDLCTISIKDNGIGIPEKYLDEIFMPFKRLHDDTAYHGSGIGLALCKRIVEICDGSIWAESCGKQGSTFSFSLHTP